MNFDIKYGFSGVYVIRIYVFFSRARFLISLENGYGKVIE